MTGVTVLDVPQRSAAWRQAWCGRLTGSRAAAMLATGKYGEALTRARLRATLVREQRTGRPEADGYVSAAMARAVSLESLAVAVYEARTGHVVRSSGFLSHDTLAVGCSLDGHIGDFDGILEVKCPQSRMYFRLLAGRPAPVGLSRADHAQPVGQWRAVVRLHELRRSPAPVARVLPRASLSRRARRRCASGRRCCTRSVNSGRRSSSATRSRLGAPYEAWQRVTRLLERRTGEDLHRRERGPVSGS